MNEQISFLSSKKRLFLFRITWPFSPKYDRAIKIFSIPHQDHVLTPSGKL